MSQVRCNEGTVSAASIDGAECFADRLPPPPLGPSLHSRYIHKSGRIKARTRTTE